MFWWLLSWQTKKSMHPIRFYSWRFQYIHIFSLYFVSICNSSKCKLQNCASIFFILQRFPELQQGTCVIIVKLVGNPKKRRGDSYKHWLVSLATTVTRELSNHNWFQTKQDSLIGRISKKLKSQVIHWG